MLFLLLTQRVTPVYGLVEVEWNLGSPPPERAQHEVDDSQSLQYVMTEKEPIEDTKD